MVNGQVARVGIGRSCAADVAGTYRDLETKPSRACAVRGPTRSRFLGEHEAQ